MLRVLLKLAYWVVVVAVSLVLVIALILFLESRDQSSVDEARGPARALAD